jgi:hypothetical protein
MAAAILLFAYSLATPDHLVDKNWDKDFLYAPILILWGLYNILRVLFTETLSRLKMLKNFIKKSR